MFSTRFSVERPNAPVSRRTVHYHCAMEDTDHEDDEWWPASARVVHDALRSLFGYKRLRDRWIEESVTLAEELQEIPPRRHASALFCIRLYGVLQDVHASTTQGIEDFEEQPSNDVLESAVRALDTVITELRAILSRDELLWLEYQRDAESHPWLTLYDHKHKSRDVVIDRRKSKLLRSHVAYLDYRNAISNVTDGRDVDDVAAAISTRTLPVLRRVLDAARRCDA